jgi:ABC-type glycerol-3-phosphate transport system substrate-binding protein
MMTIRHSASLAAAIILVSGMAEAEVTLTVLIDNNPETISSMEAVTAAYTAANPDVTFDIEQRTGRKATTSSRPGSPRARWRTSSTTTPDPSSRP